MLVAALLAARRPSHLPDADPKASSQQDFHPSTLQLCVCTASMELTASMPALLRFQYDASAHSVWTIPVVLCLAAVLASLTTPVHHSLLLHTAAWTALCLTCCLRTGIRALLEDRPGRATAYGAGLLLAIGQLCERAAGAQSLWWAHVSVNRRGTEHRAYTHRHSSLESFMLYTTSASCQALMKELRKSKEHVLQVHRSRHSCCHYVPYWPATSLLGPTRWWLSV